MTITISEGDDGMMKKVYVCSPLRGKVCENLTDVKKYARYVLLCGAAPVVPHYYAFSLNDNDRKEREIGMKAGKSLLWYCDELWVFGEVVTEGMQSEISFCESLGVPVKHIRQNQINKLLGDYTP